MTIETSEIKRAVLFEALHDFNNVKQNKKQIQTLENLRNALLPKLLSGEVRIKV